MAGADSYSPPIESRTDLIEAMAKGQKPAADWRIGTEHEKHVFHTNPLRPVAYDGPDGIHALLKGVEARTGWEPFYDGENPIGLRNNEVAGGISLEPGGQFELSGAPQKDLHAHCGRDRRAYPYRQGSWRAAGYPFSWVGRDADLVGQRNPGHAEIALRHHEAIHGKGRHAGHIDDVPLLHRAD